MKESIWQRAASFAARAHEHQVRKDGRTPYIAHAARVALIVSHIFECRDEVAIAAALLHDTIEDTKTDYDEIREAFGRPVADCVAALTKNMILEEKARERDYDRRLAAADWRARLIKVADQYDNLTDAATSKTTSAAKTAAKCRRAIKLAEGDAAKHSETRRAIQALRALMRRA
jgi:guanosine-3',5'-bis(diphosphate) 3'-pyrophosphohydrolase